MAMLRLVGQGLAMGCCLITAVNGMTMHGPAGFIESAAGVLGFVYLLTIWEPRS